MPTAAWDGSRRRRSFSSAGSPTWSRPWGAVPAEPALFKDACNRGLVSYHVLETFLANVPADVFARTIGDGRLGLPTRTETTVVRGRMHEGRERARRTGCGRTGRATRASRRGCAKNGCYGQSLTQSVDSRREYEIQTAVQGRLQGFVWINIRTDEMHLWKIAHVVALRVRFEIDSFSRVVLIVKRRGFGNL